MKIAVVHYAGLITPASSDLCGLRPFLEDLSRSIRADLHVFEWDAPNVETSLGTLYDYDVIFASGHSHGAWRLYDILSKSVIPPNVNIELATFLDLAPFGQPFAWLGWPWDAPSQAKESLCFYQRNDGLLAGVKLAPPATTIDVSAWGLHHSSMCADERVHERIKSHVLSALIRAHFDSAPSSTQT